MKLFISWSKPASHGLALLLRDWLPEVIQQVEPWVSSEDIEKGQRWSSEVGAKLEEVGQGILCVTPDNLKQPWLNFEAGALAKSLGNSRVRPLLFGLQPSQVVGPLAQFQATMANDQKDMLKLVRSLNNTCTAPLAETRLLKAFDRGWAEFADGLGRINLHPTAPVDVRRSSEDMTGEILERVRALQRAMGTFPRPSRLPRSPGPSGPGLLDSSDGVVYGTVHHYRLPSGEPLWQGRLVEHPTEGIGRVLNVGKIKYESGDVTLVEVRTFEGMVASWPLSELVLVRDMSSAAEPGEEKA